MAALLASKRNILVEVHRRIRISLLLGWMLRWSLILLSLLALRSLLLWCCHLRLAPSALLAAALL